ncbi:DUF397 domain-containing protein [Actinacidiphila sp. ITFR-21]|uniref:DUF397 domain-containing protein n=1 Tax=Actinacidiphila sp. ITFR-21 TaxID=3075199 RepID=UPI0028894EA1|nr:DUF397 domain-containing protein [Streptomyces sp. ITFR-21]WNI14690.1 DUF397 domain-containing protein [Streptomyces sp. ITFR-21]
MTALPMLDASVLPNWRKSSYSGSENAACLEITSHGDQIATRDSKNPTGPALVFSQDAWAAFVRDVVSGSFGDA